ncbi:MAG: UbiX family flavin prenyltransferase [Deltaproteobacteria bacterium]|nr:UbiX family flavin prenyltransferase [Deltaproteobacteria bacterium]
MLNLVVAACGASGAPYTRRLLQALRAAEARDVAVSVVMSPTAREVWSHECGGDVRDLGFPLYDHRDFHAPFASGSSDTQAMVVIPCSMGTLARIAHGISQDLIGRAADVMLKERRKLVLVTRETPLSLIHIENMRAVTLAGGVVMPASPSFYGKKETVEDLLDSVVGRVLDHLGVPVDRGPRWGEP